MKKLVAAFLTGIFLITGILFFNGQFGNTAQTERPDQRKEETSSLAPKKEAGTRKDALERISVDIMAKNAFVLIERICSSVTPLFF